VTADNPGTFKAKSSSGSTARGDQTKDVWFNRQPIN
jgi:hypothetical protein